jgi:hypothetical protein
VSVGLGIGLVVAGSLLGLATVGAARRLPAPVWVGLLALAGAAAGAGALAVQDHAGPGDWLLTLVALAALTPLHARLVFGPPGSRR